MWTSVEDRLPEHRDFYWGLRYRDGKHSVELVYFTDYDGLPDSQFQDPYTVGDSEGLSVEYYKDVTHWADLIEPPTLPLY